MKKIILIISLYLCFKSALIAQVTVTGSTGADANYTRLALAFTAINLSPQTGNNITITISSSITETTSALLNSGAWTTLHIYPTTSGISISGNLPAPLIDLNSADNITIDGSVNESGSAPDMIISNSNAASTSGTSTIRFRNGASGNIIKYCTLRGSTKNPISGILNFSTSPSTGNSGNIIDNNNITSSISNERPINAIYAVGSSANENNNNVISNNNFYNFLNPSAASNGIFISSFNTSWTISGNSFYETDLFIPTAGIAHYIVKIISATGGNFSVRDNFLGGGTPHCGGSAWTKTAIFNNMFTGISLSVGTALPSNIQNNTISNISWNNLLNANWTGIEVIAGSVNIGTESGNTIGSVTGTGSIVVTSSTTASITYGIKISSTGIVNCSNNNIGSVSTSNNNLNASNFYGIHYNAASGSLNINNNTIGSLSTPSSINATSGSTGSVQYVMGVYNGGSGTINITNNAIANLVNGSTNANTGDLGQITGITSIKGIVTISGNSIHDLSIGNANSQLRQTSSVCGISLSGTTTNKTITGNTIYNLSNTRSTFIGGIIGLYFDGGTLGNIVSGNFIHSLSVAGSSAGASIFGIRIASGTTTYANNIIVLGGNTASTIYGFYEAGAVNNNNFIHFNTVYIGGSASTGGQSSFALFNSTTSNTRIFENNIFVNARSNSGATGKHYAIRLLGTTNLTIDYNDYFVSGNGGTLGTLVTDRLTLASWQNGTRQDVHSRAENPLFTNPGSTTAADYRIGAELRGITIAGITTDYGSIAREDPPSMGAWERPLNKWKGSATSSVWNQPTNWTLGIVPIPDANIYFDAAPISNCQLDGDKSVTNITNSTPYQIVTNGNQLTIRGTLTFSNGAQIDASTNSSVIEFAGVVPQSIPAASFYNDQVYDLIINNASNVTLNGTLNILNNSSALSGVLDAYTTSPTIIYGGTTAQIIEVGTFLDSTVYNLTVDNTTGVSLNSLIRVNNNLAINPSRILAINPTGRATVNTLVNDGVLNLNSTSSSDIFSMIVDNYSGSGTTNAQLFITGGGAPFYNWHYVAEPFVNGISTSFLTDINARNLLLYDDSRVVTRDFNGWMYFNGYAGTSGIAAGPGFTTLDFGKGYNFYNGTDATATFTGSTAIGTTLGIIPLQYSGPTPGNPIYGLNLLGNSLTCSIDWDLVTLNGSVNAAVYYTTGNRWATYIPGGGGTNGGTKDIPPLQGFFVKANAGDASIDLSSAREHSIQTRYKKSGDQEITPKGGTAYPKIKLELSGAETSDETIVWYPDDATTGFDEKFDANKMFASEAVFSQVYTIVDGQNYVINGMPLPTDSMIIPLGVKLAKPGIYSLLKKDFISPDGYDILLIDKTNNNFTVNLKNSSEYQFSTEAGTFTDRFILKIFSLTTGIEDPETGNKDFNIYGFHGIVNIVPMNSTIYSSKGEVRVFDLTGRVIKQIKNVEWYEGVPVQVPCKKERGIYLVEITSGTKRFVGKVFLP